MLVVTIYEHAGSQKFVVHQASNNGDGNVVDVTEQYEVRTLTCEDATGLLVGWHIGKREPKA